MQRRAFRITLLALLFASGVGAGLLVWSVAGDARGLTSSERSVAERLDRLAGLVASLATAQQAYGAWRQTDEQWFRHIAALVERIYAESAALSTEIRPGTPSQHLRDVADASGVMVQATARARENLGLGRDLMAADLLLGETRENVESLSTSLDKLRSSEASAFAAERAALDERSWLVLGGVAALWAVGLLALGMTSQTRALESPTDETAVPGLVPEPANTPSVEAPSIDLPSAAELCTAISRATSADALPNLLARTATILDASGIIVWMSSGAELFAVSSYGYEPGLVDRISPILQNSPSRSLATEAWHAGETRIAAGDAGANGAIVAPIWGPVAGVGLLAAEVRHGRENDLAVRAVIEMIAAQLATTLAPLPAADEETGRAGNEFEPLTELPMRATGA